MPAELIETEEAEANTWKLDEPIEVPGKAYLDAGIAFVTQPIAVSVFHVDNDVVLGPQAHKVMWHEDEGVFRLHLDVALRGQALVIRALS